MRCDRQVRLQRFAHACRRRASARRSAGLKAGRYIDVKNAVKPDTTGKSAAAGRAVSVWYCTGELSMRLLRCSVLALSIAAPAYAQLAPPNADGVSLGDWHW